MLIDKKARTRKRMFVLPDAKYSQDNIRPMIMDIRLPKVSIRVWLSGFIQYNVSSRNIALSTGRAAQKSRKNAAYSRTFFLAAAIERYSESSSR